MAEKKTIIKRIPLPLSGVMLGTLSLGNLLQSVLPQGVGRSAHIICGVLGALMLMLLLAKLVTMPRMFVEDLKTPALLGVSATFHMSWMLFAGYWRPALGAFSHVIWSVAAILQTALFLYFTVSHVMKPNLPQVRGSYFIVYSGVIMIGLTAGAYGHTLISKTALWVGFLCAIPVFVLVTVRYLALGEPADQTKRLICIYTAPFSMSVATMIEVLQPDRTGLMTAFYALTFMIYLFALSKAIQYIRLPFAPSIASYTFPFVASALAANKMSAYRAAAGLSTGWIRPIAGVETVIAVFFVIYAIVRFARFIFGANE